MSRSAFADELARRQPDFEPQQRRWIYVPYDQLNDQIGPLSREAPDGLGVILIEAPHKAARRRYHRQKLALVLANQRHFAVEQARRGVAVHHMVSPGDYGEAIDSLPAEFFARGPVQVMTPAERELRQELEAVIARGKVEVLPHEGWLTTREQFDRSQKKGTQYRMDAFYRVVRRDTGILMDGKKPVGGKFSFDADNRKPWSGDPPAPPLPSFRNDPIKQEVIELIEQRYADHPGKLDPGSLPVTRKDAERLWRWARENCLPLFGPFEDAMSTRSTNLFHTRLSSLMNLQRILPRQVVDDVVTMDLPLASQEGFLRQVLGWREFVRHVHEATDGFRHLPDQADQADQASPNFLEANRPLPPAFWGTPSGLNCLDQVVQSVWDEGYSHHITRLMVLSNLATLLDLSPRELTDWFWVAYTDAYDWVVEPNVLGMGTFATGPLMTTKPYVSGAAYINKMSDYCDGCAFDPKKTCPITHLYWAFLARHADRLADNQRLRMPLSSLRRRDPQRRAEDEKRFQQVTSALAQGERLDHVL